MELGPKKYEKKNYVFFLRCEVWDEVVEQKGALPPSKSSIGSKKSAPQKIMFFIFYFICFIYFYRFYQFVLFFLF